MALVKDCMLMVSFYHYSVHAVITTHYYTGGAMRLPGKPDDKEKTHFLTDFYNKLFKLQLSAFNNYDEHAFLKFYNCKAISIKGEKFNLSTN